MRFIKWKFMLRTHIIETMMNHDKSIKDYLYRPINKLFW